MDYFQLMRNFWDFCFENPDKIKPNHCALYCFTVEHCNRLGWKQKFGLPTTMAKDAIGIRSYNTYISTLLDLVDYGFIELIEKSKNQYSSNIIALSNYDKALDKALDKASIKHVTKQSESIGSINKPIYKETNIQLSDREIKFKDDCRVFLSEFGKDILQPFFDYWSEPNHAKTKMRFELEKTFDIKRRLKTWKRNGNTFEKKTIPKQSML